MRQVIIGISMAAVLAMGTVAVADITIGVNVSSTGPAASLGIAEKNAVSLGPSVIAGQKVHYIVYDDATDTTKAVQNVKRLITEANADVLIGPTSGPTSKAVIDPVAESKTPMIQLAPSPWASADDPKKRWIFSATPADDVFAAGLIRHMIKKGVKKVSVIAVDDAYGENCTGAYMKFAEQKGIKTLTIEKYKRSDTSATAQALRAMQGNPDAVYIVGAGTPGALPHVALIERGYKGKIYQSGGSANSEFLRVGGKALEGSYMLATPLLAAEQFPDGYPGKKEALEFIKAYDAKYGPRNFFASLVWSSMKIIEAAVPKALKVAKPGTEQFRVALRDAIESTKGLKGAGAVVTMSKTDHTGINELGMCILRVENGKWKLDEHAEYK